MLLVGFEKGDDAGVLKKMASKVLKSRLFEDCSGKTNLSIFDVGGAILSVSQFTLAASLKEGNRPSFFLAMPPLEAKSLYALWNDTLKGSGLQVETGVFGANMQIELVNDGPFTIIYDSKELFGE